MDKKSKELSANALSKLNETKIAFQNLTNQLSFALIASNWALIGMKDATFVVNKNYLSYSIISSCATLFISWIRLLLDKKHHYNVYDSDEEINYFDYRKTPYGLISEWMFFIYWFFPVLSFAFLIMSVKDQIC